MDWLLLLLLLLMANKNYTVHFMNGSERMFVRMHKSQFICVSYCIFSMCYEFMLRWMKRFLIDAHSSVHIYSLFISIKSSIRAQFLFSPFHICYVLVLPGNKNILFVKKNLIAFAFFESNTLHWQQSILHPLWKLHHWRTKQDEIVMHALWWNTTHLCSITHAQCKWLRIKLYAVNWMHH